MITPPGDCPVCKRVDFVQKVPAIYRNSFSTTMETQLTTTTTVTYNSEGQPVYNSMPETTIVPITRQTKLGVLLKPPQIKKPPAPPLETLFIVLAPSLCIVGLAASFVIATLYSSAAGLLACGISIGLPILLPILAHWVLFRKTHKHRRRLLQEEKERTWHLTKYWELLCYCHRCDCVFFPGEDKAVRPEQLQELYLDIHTYPMTSGN